MDFSVDFIEDIVRFNFSRISDASILNGMPLIATMYNDELELIGKKLFPKIATSQKKVQPTKMVVDMALFYTRMQPHLKAVPVRLNLNDMAIKLGLDLLYDQKQKYASIGHAVETLALAIRTHISEICEVILNHLKKSPNHIYVEMDKVFSAVLEYQRLGVLLGISSVIYESTSEYDKSLVHCCTSCLDFIKPSNQNELYAAICSMFKLGDQRVHDYCIRMLNYKFYGKLNTDLLFTKILIPLWRQGIGIPDKLLTEDTKAIFEIRTYGEDITQDYKVETLNPIGTSGHKEYTYHELHPIALRLLYPRKFWGYTAWRDRPDLSIVLGYFARREMRNGMNTTFSDRYASAIYTIVNAYNSLSKDSQLEKIMHWAERIISIWESMGIKYQLPEASEKLSLSAEIFIQP